MLWSRPPAPGTPVCRCSSATLSSAEEADWRRRRKRPTRPARAGEGWGRVHYAPARPRALGEPGYEPHGRLFTRTFRATRIAAVSQCLMSTGTAPPDGGKSTTVPESSGTASCTPGAALVVRGTSPGASRPERGARENPIHTGMNSTGKGLRSAYYAKLDSTPMRLPVQPGTW